MKYKMREMAKSLYIIVISNAIDADHQNNCLFTNKGHFSSPLWVLIGALAKLHTLPIALTRLLE